MLSDSLDRLPLIRKAMRFQRRLTAPLRPSRVEMVYHARYRSPDNPFMDPRRADKILGHLIREGYMTGRRVHRPGPPDIRDLARVHTFRYLESVGEPSMMVRVFGEEILRLEADAVISCQRRMVSGTLMATQLALSHRGPNRWAVNLGGGMHHAGKGSGGGFCLFNDVAVAIHRLRDRGYGGKILVVDLDLHQGDGTRQLFAEDPTVYTFSMHATAWEESPAKACLDVALGTGIGDGAYLEALDENLHRAFEESQPDLVFYVAGVDIASDDRYGSWRVSADGILERDQRVVREVGRRPAVWLLAGGYGQDAWRHSARSLLWLLGGRSDRIPTESDRALRHFRAIAGRFSKVDLTADPDRDRDTDLTFSAEDIMADLEGPQRKSRLLGFYSRHGVETSLERYGVLERIRRHGYRDFEVELDPNHSVGERIRVYSRDERRDLLVELVLRDSRQFEPFRLLSLEWLLAQNPRGRPTPERPLLPGQEHPGLGALRHIIMMLVMACERLDFDGIGFTPAHYHVAAQARGLLSFLHPEDEARFDAIGEALMGVPLAQATHIVGSGGLVDAHTGETVVWRAADMALPVSDRFKAHFEGREYEHAVEAHSKNLRFERAG